ncbi:MAG: hypothetical protein MJE68_16925 [Proteobacteria bacterium]|nr:hypothetical protein [Pseudomonadota bacterium]
MLVESDGTSSLYISLWEGVLVLQGCEIFCEILSLLLLGLENISLWEGVLVLKGLEIFSGLSLLLLALENISLWEDVLVLKGAMLGIGLVSLSGAWI